MILSLLRNSSIALLFLFNINFAFAQTIGSSSGGITIGAPVNGTCTNGYNIYNNNGTVGCQADTGTGTVTSVSVATANGFSGTVANPTTTPAITIIAGAITPTSVAIGAGSAITSSGAGGSLGSNAFTSIAYAPLASPTFTGTITGAAITATGTITLSGLSAGTQTSCIGLNVSNVLVTASCGGGSSTIVNNSTLTTGFTSGDAIGTSGSVVVDTNIAYANIAVINAANTFVSGQKIQASGATGNNASTVISTTTSTAGNESVSLLNDTSGGSISIAAVNSVGAGTTLLTMPNSGRLISSGGSSGGLYIGSSVANTNVVLFAGGTVTATNTAVTISGTNQLIQFNKYTTAGIIINDSSGNLTSSTSIKPGINSHYSYGGSAPALSACGTSPSIDGNATDSSGTVTVGSVATGCVITFANAYTTFNHCRITSQSSISGLAYAYSKSAITISASVLGGDLIDYSCDGI